MKRILMIAYHFPPLAGSSGIQRTLRFVQHLPKFGWQPIVLTCDPRAYENTSDDLLADIPPDTVVRRAFALDTSRHLSIGGRYPGFMARPDRWMTWRFAGIREGMRLIREFEPAVIWSTYPIATAHVIAAELHRRSGLPWIADFRDPMAQDGYPADPRTWQSFKCIEEQAMQQATLALFTTPGATRLYRERYPHAAQRIELLENGYDEEAFADVERQITQRAPLNPGYLTLLHSGIVYPEERDPTALIAVLGDLQRTKQPAANRLKLRFRAPVHDDLLRRLAMEHGVAESIEIMPSIPYRAALEEMLRADGLLILQAANCNDQIPAKLYEYLRAGRPVIALTDPAGDTAQTLLGAGISTIAPLDDRQAIGKILLAFADQSLHGALPTIDAAAAASRRGRSEALARMLDNVVPQPLQNSPK
ncbi:MAG: glycosyltransferase [Sideroxyarcus sp.]|nr:glycosyltransferase [Sideroxyarcus sp.]